MGVEAWQLVWLQATRPWVPHLGGCRGPRVAVPLFFKVCVWRGRPTPCIVTPFLCNDVGGFAGAPPFKLWAKCLDKQRYIYMVTAAPMIHISCFLKIKNNVAVGIVGLALFEMVIQIRFRTFVKMKNEFN